MHLSREPVDRRFEITAPELALGDTAIRGLFNNVECHAGLRVHATDTLEAHDMTMQWRMRPSLTVAVVLEGTLDAWLGDQKMPLGRIDGPIGQVWSLTRTTTLRRSSRKGVRMRKVIISLPPDWVRPLIDRGDGPNGNLETFIGRHGATMAWTPSPQALSLAEQIIAPPDMPEAVHRLAVESRAIEIVREALSRIIAPAAEIAPTRAGPRAQARARRIRRYLQDHPDTAPSLSALAREFGMSIGSMQAAFKSAYGTTIAEFRRELRLQRARAAIEQDGISISQAAYAAGYTSPASFSTAFKRHYGIAPSALKE